VFSHPTTEDASIVIRGCHACGPALSSRTPAKSRPLAVSFHESDRSTASGLRFGLVEVLFDDAEPLARGYMPELGAAALARILGVRLQLVASQP